MFREPSGHSDNLDFSDRYAMRPGPYQVWLGPVEMGRARASNPFRAKFRGATGLPRVGSSLDPGRAAQPRAPSVVKTGGNMA